ncbi:hypothetical protein LSCM1_05510 [Leishmania martiniquensis]|uniref:Uncharacterized protein n=1 Tax=Leishmania martiniquensis TaxID=1580590 RepID=A0A836KXE3_9TRYP|nr:hypothetical protein LSCM1_05510 [Leishmania martiniquensis]
MTGQKKGPLVAPPRALWHRLRQADRCTPMPNWKQQTAAVMRLSDKGSGPAAPPVITGASRFNVVFSRSSGSRKQRSRREGALSVAHDVAYLYDKDNNECVLRCKAVGPAPNGIFACMERAHRGADWVAGAELNFCGFNILIEETMELHLIPYGEDAAVVAANAAENDSGAGAGCGVTPCSRALAPTASPALSRRTLSAPAPRSPGSEHTTHAQLRFLLPRRAPLHCATTMASRATHDDGCSSPMPLEEEAVAPTCALQEWSPPNAIAVSTGSLPTPPDPTDAPPSAPGDERGINGSGGSDICLPHQCRQRQQRRRRRSVTSLARELERCYPQYF